MSPTSTKHIHYPPDITRINYDNMIKIINNPNDNTYYEFYCYSYIIEEVLKHFKALGFEIISTIPMNNLIRLNLKRK